MPDRNRQRDPEGDLDREGRGEDRIPKSRVDAMVESAKTDAAKVARAEERARIETERREAAEATAASPQPRVDEPKVYTREELQAFVDEGRITDTQMQNQLETQQENRIRETVSKEVREETSASQRAQSIQAEIDTYTKVIPDLTEHGSDNRSKVETEIRRLVANGYPADISTEAVALKICFGEPDSHRKIPRQPSEETAPGGGGAGQDESDFRAPEGAPKGLSATRVKHYEKHIELGRYKGWDDPALLAEMKHIPGVEVSA